MPHQPRALNGLQDAVLRWVAEGCPDGRFEGYGHRVSAAFLKGSGLIRVRGHGSSWKAEITDAGRRYLDHNPTPPGPGERQQTRAPAGEVRDVAGQVTRPGGTAPRAQDERPRSGPTPVRRTSRPTKTEQLVADLVAAGGVLRLPVRYGKSGPTARQRAYAAQDAGKLPEGKVLTTRVIGGELEIRHVDGTREAPEVIERDLSPVPVPTEIDKLQPAARQFERQARRHEVSTSLLPRAGRIIHAIATEARARGWRVVTPRDSTERGVRYPWAPARDGHLESAAEGRVFTLRLKEEGVKTRGRWEDEVKYAEESIRWSWRATKREPPSGPYDAGATGRLILQLEGGQPWRRSHRQSSFGDRRGATVEERLLYLFREIEVRIVETARAEEDAKARAERAAEEARRAAEERERQWHVLMERAKVLFAEDHRAKELARQADAWREVERLRPYCAAMEGAYGDDPEVGEWLAFAREQIARTDPLAAPPTMPPTPEITPEQLKPFLPRGWSPYGPRAWA